MGRNWNGVCCFWGFDLIHINIVLNIVCSKRAEIKKNSHLLVLPVVSPGPCSLLLLHPAPRPSSFCISPLAPPGFWNISRTQSGFESVTSRRSMAHWTRLRQKKKNVQLEFFFEEFQVTLLFPFGLPFERLSIKEPTCGDVTHKDLHFTWLILLVWWCLKKQPFHTYKLCTSFLHCCFIVSDVDHFRYYYGMVSYFPF